MGQIELWKSATGRKYWTDVLELTPYFFAEKRSQPKLRPDTVNKTLKKRPAKDEGLYNTFTLLGTLYLLGGIKDLETIRTFVNDCKLGIPKDITLDEICEQIQSDSEIGRQGLLSTNPKLPVSNLKVEPDPGKVPLTIFYNLFMRRYGRMLLLLAILLPIVLLLIAILGRYLLPVQEQVSSLSIISTCSAPADAATPVFLHDQGFSIFQSFAGGSQSFPLSNTVRSMGINPQGVWLGYTADGKIDGVSYYDKIISGNLPLNQWGQCNGLHLRQGQVLNDFTFTNDSVFVAMDRGNPYPEDPGVARLTASGWIFYSRAKGLPSSIVYSVQTDEKGDIWATTYNGVAKLSGEYWKTVYQFPQDGLASNKVSRLLKDKNGNIWFALVDRGISRLKPNGQWQSYYSDITGVQNGRGIVADNEGGVWFATDGGVLRFKDEKWTQFTSAQNHLLSDDVQDVEYDKFGRIWIATLSGVMYTADFGQSWIIHSTLPTLKIRFGCPGCMYDDNHLWLVLKEDRGVGHVRIPPPHPTIRIVSSPARVQLKPHESYVFKVDVEVLAESLNKIQDGDALYSSDPNGTNLHGAYPIVEMTQDSAEQGKTYTFSNINNPIIAPDKSGIYTLHWRVWQGRRYVTEPITIEFEVIAP